MTQAPHIYPLGVQSFEEIRTGGMLYVDKTRYIWDMTRPGAKYYFLSRPRRFGKTLLVSTLEAYFRGRRELFDGLAIGDLETEWPEHPVLRFDLSMVKAKTPDGLRDMLSRVLEPYEERWGGAGRERTLSTRVDYLICRAHEQSGISVAVLIDEYDAPLLSAMGDPGRLREIREVMREFYAPLKKNEDKIRFLFITGITKFSQLSIFSELNNLRNISMLPAFAGVCGITADELGEHLSDGVAWFAGQQGMTPEEGAAALGRKYDGYHFCEGSPDIFNPHSLLSALGDGRLASYWFETGTPTVLTEVLGRYDVDPSSIEGVVAPASEFDAPTERMASPIPLLYQGGYLTIKGYDRDFNVYTLGVPNEEVSEGLYRTLLPCYAPVDERSRNSFVTAFSRAVLRDDDIDAALRLLRSFMASIPYDLAPTDEKRFQAVLYVVFRLVGAYVDSEVRTAAGRIDLTLETRTSLYVIELKYDRPAAEALAQIGERGYLIPYEAGGKRLVKVGASFSTADRTVAEGWLIEGA